MKRIFLVTVLFMPLTIKVDARKQTLNRQNAPLYTGDNVTLSSQDIQTFTLNYRVDNDLSLYCFLTTLSSLVRSYLTVSITNLFTAQTGAKLLSPFFSNLIINKSSLKKIKLS
ncbi:MAG: hypothetical protein LBL13_11420 [Bacteroidales bacterium]|jgi:hypothetical protein|nr:hypothetical protein [Bacteroidales bacterium]